jgi:hypothetical protein
MSVSIELAGKLHKILPDETKNASFPKQPFVLLVEDDKYPFYRKLYLTNAEKVAELNKFKPGDSIIVSVNLAGSQPGKVWTNPKDGQEGYFNEDRAWRISKGTGTSGAPSPAAKPKPAAFDTNAFHGDDDLPF